MSRLWPYVQKFQLRLQAAVLLYAECSSCVQVRHLRHLVQLVEGSTERFVRFEVGPHGEEVTLEARQLREVTAEILAAHNIAQPRSDDLM